MRSYAEPLVIQGHPIIRPYQVRRGLKLVDGVVVCFLCGSLQGLLAGFFDTNGNRTFRPLRSITLSLGQLSQLPGES